MITRLMVIAGLLLTLVPTLSWLAAWRWQRRAAARVTDAQTDPSRRA